jgi:hypothetical protein
VFAPAIAASINKDQDQMSTLDPATTVAVGTGPQPRNRSILKHPAVADDRYVAAALLGLPPAIVSFVEW